MLIKKGDNVIVISGSDKGKTGKVAVAFPSAGKVLIEGVNVKKRHQKQSRENQKGQIVEKAMPIRVSKVMIIDPSTNKKTRIGSKMIADKKVRIGVRSGKEI